MKNGHYVTAFETYLLTEKRVAKNTFAAYKKDIAQLVEFLGEQDLLKITVDDLKKFLHAIHKEGISARSMARKISTLKAFFNFLQERFEIENYAKELRFPRLEKKLPHYLTEDEIKQLFAQATKDHSAMGERNRVMLYLMYVSGIRVSELVWLKKSDVQLDTGMLHVHGKGGKQRIVPLSHQMCGMLEAYMQTIYQQLIKKGTTDYLFPVAYAGKLGPLSRQSFWNIIKKIWRKTGNKKNISPHQLRHSLATHMLKNGADLRSLQVLLGHENVATVQVYTHVEKSHLRDVYDKKHPRS